MRRQVRKKETYDWTADEPKWPETNVKLPTTLVYEEALAKEEEETIAIEVVPQYDPFEEHRIQLAREQREQQREINRQEASLPFELKLMEQFSPHELGVKSRLVRPKMFDDVEDGDPAFIVDDDEDDVRGRIADMGVEEEVFESLRGAKYQMTAEPDHRRMAVDFNPIDDMDEEAREWEEQQLRKVKLGGVKLTEGVKKTTAKQMAHIPLAQQLINLQGEQCDLEASLGGMREQLNRLETRVMELEAEAALAAQRVERNAFYRNLTLLLQRLDRESQAVIHELETGNSISNLETNNLTLTPASVIVEALGAWQTRDPTGYEQAHAHLYLTQLLEPHARVLISRMNDLDLDGLRVELGLTEASWDHGWREMLCQIIVPRLTHFDHGQLIEQLTRHLGPDHRLVMLTRDLIEFK